MRRILETLTLTVALATTGIVGASAHDLLLGVNTHAIDYPGAQPLMLDLARKLGVDSVRADAQWKLVETRKGQYQIPPAWDQFVDRARRRGIAPLLILDYGNPFYDGGHLPRSPAAIAGFARYAAFVVRHFAGRVRYYEVWNEWNTGTGGYYPGGSAADYARLFDATDAAIKRVDPNAVVLAAAGYQDWYAQIGRLGVAARADGVAMHPYVPKEPGYRESVGSNGPERSAQYLIDTEATLRRFSGGREIPLYVTEIGWPTSTGRRGYPEADVAAMTERSLLLYASLPYVRGVWWYSLIDDSPDASNPEARFGLFRQHYAMKPAAGVFQSLAPLAIHNDLRFDPHSNLGAGLVILGHSASPRPAVIAWQIPNEPRGGGPTLQFVVTCDPALRVTRSFGGAAGGARRVLPVPAAFTYRAGHCTREPLLGRP